MDININISKTHVFAETFFRKKKPHAKNSASGTLIFHFSPSSLLVVLAEGLSDKPRIKSFLRLDTDTAQPDPDRAKALQDYLSALGFKSAPYVMAVASDGISFRQLTMPAMPDADLKQAVGWELKKKFFLNPEEQLVGILGVHDLDSEDGPQKMVNVFHAEKKPALARLSILTALGLSIQAFWPGQSALARLSAWQGAKDESDSLVVDIAGAQVRILAVQKGLTMLSRVAPTGVTGVGFPESAFERLLAEIQRSIEFYETQKFARPIGRILLMGSGYDAAEVSGYLGKKLTIPVSTVDGSPFVSESLSEEQRSLVTSQPGLFAEALGALAIREETLNLMPDEIRLHNRRRQLDQSMRKVFLGVASVLTFWVAWVGVQGQIMAARAGFVEKEWAEIQTGKSAFTDIMSQEKNRRVALKGSVDLPGLMKELSRLTPSPIMLDSLKFSRADGTVKISGTAQDTANEQVKLITQYVSSLGASPFFTTVTLGQTMEEGGEGKVRFQVDATVRSYV